MNDEEKKALEQLKYMNEDGCEKCVYGEDKTCINCWEAHKEIILNLIEKQSKEIEELTDKNKKLKDKAKELIFEKQELTSALLDSTPNDKIKAKIEPVLKQLERKMEEEYNKYGNSREYQDVVDAYNFLQSLLEKEGE